ncbi:MAG TPA: lantibiotic dehydratase [Ktedonobacteraceae bacterium]
MAEQKTTANRQAEPLYTSMNFALLRAPALPAQIFTRLSAVGHLCPGMLQGDLDCALQTSRENSAQVIEELAAQPQIIQAIAVASPSLLRGLERLRQGEGSSARQKRVQAGLLRYLIRMSTRPTPFGLFSGVALSTFTSETRLSLASPSIGRFRTRPDMSWLLALLRRIEEDRMLVIQCKVRLNQTAYLVGERAVLPVADTYGELDDRAISLRATPVVRKIFELAREYIPYRELQKAIQQTFPQATGEQIERLLWQLWEHHFFISQLHPPLTDARPAEYIRKHLEALSGAEQFREHLDRMLEEVAALDQAGIGAPVSMIAALVQGQEELITAESTNGLPLQIDSALHVKTPEIHHTIGQAAARAAEFLLRQTPLPNGPQNLQEYRALFCEKYGEQAEVPLLDLLSPENGLDAPAGYEKPPRTSHRAASPQTRTTGLRNQVLLGLVTQAVNTQSLEVELTEEIQRELERWSPRLEEAPLSLEVYLQLHATSCEAVDRGEWTAVVGRNCGSPHAGRTFGRFFDLLGSPGMEALRNLARCEEALQSEVIFAELSYQPSYARLANVAIRPPIRAYEIAVGTTPASPPERVLSLNDLVVGVQRERFYLRSLSKGAQVRISQTHMLNSQRAPNVCRFLTEIASDGLPALSPFDWGAVASAPFLPRLVIKIGPSARLVITPTCWQLRAGTIPPLGEGSEEARWFRGLQRWREVWRVPRYVYLSHMDNRLLLDLEHPLMAEELHDELRKLTNEGQLTLDELLPDFEHLWLRDEQDAGYFSEIVVPLLRSTGAPSQVSSEAQKKPLLHPRQVITPTERSRFPGEEWIYLKLYAAPGQHEELLAGPVRKVVRLLQERELIDRWFFIRYADPEPHLRLRFHAKEAEHIQATLALSLSWSMQLARGGQIQRYMLDTYEREVERYGGPAAIDLLEQVFMVDSAMVSDLVAFRHARRLNLDPLAVAVFTLDHFFASWGRDLQQRQAWTCNASEREAFRNEFRAERKRYCDLLAPQGKVDPNLAEQRSLVLDLLRPHEGFLAALSAQVRQLEEAGRLWVGEVSLLSSLAHMHLNRLLGIDRTRETKIYAFWRHTLDALERRPK